MLPPAPVYNSTVFGPGLVHSVLVGSQVILSCPAPAPWLLCIWVSPGGDRWCQVSLQEDRLEVCGQQDSLLTSTRAGGSGGCEVRLVSEVRHHGVWTCMLTLDTAGQYESLVTRLGLSVTSPPSLSLSHNETHLTCWADNGYPAPSLSWHLDHSLIPPVSEETVMVMSPSSHLVSTTSSLSLTSLPRNTTLLSCTVRQPQLVRTIETNIKTLTSLLTINQRTILPPSNSVTDMMVIILCAGLCCLGKLHNISIDQSESQTAIIFQAWLSVF